jgi:hypothetical protein
MTARLHIGMGDAYGLRVTVLSSPDFDPSVVTAATVNVTKPSGAQVTWTGSIVEKDADHVIAAYTFSQAGTDLDEAGSWRAWIQWDAPGFTIGPRTEVFDFMVARADHT